MLTTTVIMLRKIVRAYYAYYGIMEIAFPLKSKLFKMIKLCSMTLHI